MLTAVIIFLPGTGGSFLCRTLTLSEKTVFGDTVSESNYGRHIDSKTRLSSYKWDSKDWKKEESKFVYAYRRGLLDFYHYETTPFKLIDNWHPEEFYRHDQNSICWNKGAWPKYIFIQPNESHKSFLLKNQTTKKYKLDWDTEIKYMKLLRTQYGADSIDIEFDDFFNQTRFVDNIQRIDQILDLDLSIDLVKIAWQEWYDESQKIWKK